MDNCSHESSIRTALTAAKYIFSAALIFAATYASFEWSLLLAGIGELMLVFLATNYLAEKNGAFATALNGLLLLVFNIQSGVRLFASSFVTPLMLMNLFNLEDLVGNAGTYIAATVIAVCMSILPIGFIRLPRPSNSFWAAIATVLLAAVALAPADLARPPISASIRLVAQIERYRALAEQASSKAGTSLQNPEQSTYYHETIPGGISMPSSLPSHPNVVIIFTEGLSQSVIDDGRGIMPNVARYQGEALSFTSYYNHTAATFRGLNGQLYSGFQLEDASANSLISLQDILMAEGYSTSFINAEPNHEIWTRYLSSMGFNRLIGESSSGVLSLDGSKMSDGDSYQTLKDTMLQQEWQPFLICVYTFGTHVSLDSVEETWGDGSDPLLNRFWNCDYQFGKFMEWFEDSQFSDNTVIVFTTDHGTCSDLDWTSAFPDNDRTTMFCDQIPLFYYYPGIVPSQYDVEGRNSLDFAPTLLDYLDVDSPNCFLGDSLFLDSQEDSLDTIYYDGAALVSTTGGQITQLNGTDAEQEVLDEIIAYISSACTSLEQARD